MFTFAQIIAENKIETWPQAFAMVGTIMCVMGGFALLHGVILIGKCKVESFLDNKQLEFHPLGQS